MAGTFGQSEPTIDPLVRTAPLSEQYGVLFLQLLKPLAFVAPFSGCL